MRIVKEGERERNERERERERKRKEVIAVSDRGSRERGERTAKLDRGMTHNEETGQQ